MSPTPQLENGYTKIANEILEALALTQLSGYQVRCLFYLLRKTYGWQGKKCDRISLSQWMDGTGLKKSHVCRTLNELTDRNIVTKNGNKYGFNKQYQGWRALPKLGPGKKGENPLPKLVTRGPKIGNIGVPKLGHTKENKETIQKKEKTGAEKLPKLVTDKEKKIKDFELILKIKKNYQNWPIVLVDKGLNNYAFTGESWDDFISRISLELPKLKGGKNESSNI
jgi:phage replication O-like protein O